VVEMTVRCKSFPTGNEPGGVKYYSTKDDTPYNALEWTLGSGLIFLSLTTNFFNDHLTKQLRFIVTWIRRRYDWYEKEFIKKN